MKLKLGKWVLAARKHKGWTQEQLGERLNLTKANISAWENERHEPSYDRLVEIASLTGYPLAHSQNVNPSGWPLSNELLAALRRATPETRTMVENQSRVAVGLATLLDGESSASAMDVETTFDASAQLTFAPSSSPFGAEVVDLDQDLAATLNDLAVASKTMTPTQRAAMGAALRGIKETSWDTTPEGSSGHTVRILAGTSGNRPVYRSPGNDVRTGKKVTK